MKEQTKEHLSKPAKHWTVYVAAFAIAGSGLFGYGELHARVRYNGDAQKKLETKVDEALELLQRIDERTLNAAKERKRWIDQMLKQRPVP